MKKKKSESIFVKIVINGTVIAKKELKVSEKNFVSILMKAKRGKK
jgi:hypothetical protein